MTEEKLPPGIIAVHRIYKPDKSVSDWAGACTLFRKDRVCRNSAPGTEGVCRRGTSKRTPHTYRSRWPGV